MCIYMYICIDYVHHGVGHDVLHVVRHARIFIMAPSQRGRRARRYRDGIRGSTSSVAGNQRRLVFECGTEDGWFPNVFSSIGYLSPCKVVLTK